MPDHLTVTFPYSPVEHAKALSEADTGRKLRWRIRFGGFVIGFAGVLAAVVGPLTGEPVVSALQDGTALAALGAFWVWGAPALLTAIEARQLRREGIQESREVAHLTFGEAGFAPPLRWSEPMPWSFVERVVETKRFLLIYHGYSTDPFYIPKHALSPSDRERLVALLNEHLKSPQKQLKMLSEAT